MKNDGGRGRGSENFRDRGPSGAPMRGAGRRTYPSGGAGPRVGKVATDVPRAERIDSVSDRRFEAANRPDKRYGGAKPAARGGYGGAGEGRGTYHPENRAPRYAGYNGTRPDDRRAEGVGRETFDPKRRGLEGGPVKPRPPKPAYVPPKPPKPAFVPPAAPPIPSEPPVPPVPPVQLEMENLLCGRNPIREALRAGRPVEKLLVASGDLSGAAKDIVRLAKEAGAIVQYVDRARLDQIYPAHQGMLAYVAAVPYSTVDEMLDAARERGEDPLLVILDGITDPHNLGAIVRTAECVGAHGVIIPERRASGLTPAAAKAAAGALNHMKIARVPNVNRTIDALKERGVWIVGTSMDGEPAFSADLTGPMALVIGSEGDGISHLTMQKCDRLVTLPMKGHIESLNASVAAGVMLYEIARARAL